MTTMEAIEHDPLLDRDAQAALLGVDPTSITKFAQMYKPGGRFPDHPYPTNVPGQHVVAGRSKLVARSILETWAKNRPGKTGRPRMYPPDLTVPQWRGLHAIAAGEAVRESVAGVLLVRGLVKKQGGALVPTVDGRKVIDEYPLPDEGDDRG
jgi:hypothetical protein